MFHIYSTFEVCLCSNLSSFFSQIEDGEIYANINQKDGMVCFHDNPEKYNNPAMLHKIDQEVCNDETSMLMYKRTRPWSLNLNTREQHALNIYSLIIYLLNHYFMDIWEKY